jgi:hypothetical protein
LATTSVTLEFTIACTSSASNQTSKTSAQVTESSASSSSSSSSSGKSGGGSIDLWMLLGLSGLAVRRLKKSSG